MVFYLYKLLDLFFKNWKDIFLNIIQNVVKINNTQRYIYSHVNIYNFMDKLKIDACYESDDHSALYILSK